MYRFFARRQPSFERILLIESGARKVTEQILLYLYQVKQSQQLDLLTCYESPPKSFDYTRGVVYSVNDPEARTNRSAFIKKLSSGPYTVLGILCTGSPILERWKWMVALRTAARIIVLNEEANYFGLEVWSLPSAQLMLRKRLNPFTSNLVAGAAGASSLVGGLAGHLAGLFLFPFTVSYLLAYTVALHLRRRLRSLNRSHRKISFI